MGWGAPLSAASTSGGVPGPSRAHLAAVVGARRGSAGPQPADEGAAGFLAEDVAVGQAPLAHRPLDDLRHAARNPAEELVSRVYQLMRGKPGAAGLLRCLSRRRRSSRPEAPPRPASTATCLH